MNISDKGSHGYSVSSYYKGSYRGLCIRTYVSRWSMPLNLKHWTLSVFLCRNVSMSKRHFSKGPGCCFSYLLLSELWLTELRGTSEDSIEWLACCPSMHLRKHSLQQKLPTERLPSFLLSLAAFDLLLYVLLISFFLFKSKVDSFFPNNVLG